MPSVVSHIAKLFADDSKLIATIRSDNDLKSLQQDLNALMEWSNTWRMLFHVNKCKVMEFSRSGKSKLISTELFMGESDARNILKSVEFENDLGVTLDRNLKFSSHIRIQANKANCILGQLRKTFRFSTIDTCKTLYCAYVRPHLEYASLVPSSKRDIRALETVQRRATKLVLRIRNWSYEDRLYWV